MTEPRRFSGKTVDEATDNALEALDVNQEDVEIVVVNPGRSGILGFGGEPAEIDVTLLEPDVAGVPGSAGGFFQAGSPEGEFSDDSDDDEEDEYDDDEPESEEEGEDGEFAPLSDDDDEFDEEPVQAAAPYSYAPASAPVAPHAPKSVVGAESRDESRDSGNESGPVGHAPAAPTRGPERRERPSEPDPEVIEFASEVIDYFLASMGVVADTYIREETDDGVPVFDIEGEDSGLLIGRRGETLQSFQYLVNLIVTHQLGRSAYVQIDIEGYKERRHETLTAVARRTAERVVESGDAIELEPMPAYERRWIHMALADSPEVRTESSGEGSDRFVVIHPRNGGDGSRSPRRRGGRRGHR